MSSSVAHERLKAVSGVQYVLMATSHVVECRIPIYVLGWQITCSCSSWSIPKNEDESTKSVHAHVH